VREGLRLLLNAQEDMEVIGEANDGKTAWQRSETLNPDVVIMDVTMAGMNGLQATRKIKELQPATAVVALTRHSDEAYVQELVTNEDLRDSIVDDYQSVRSAVDRASSSKQPISALFDDKKLQKELKNAGENIRDSAVTLREAPDGGSSGGGLGRKLLLLVVAAGLALAVSEDLRKKVLDALFGAEEEFEYTSTTSSSSSNGPASTATSETPAAS